MTWSYAVGSGQSNITGAAASLAERDREPFLSQTHGEPVIRNATEEEMLEHIERSLAEDIDEELEMEPEPDVSMGNPDVWDLDDELLARLEAREDMELGADH